MELLLLGIQLVQSGFTIKGSKPSLKATKTLKDVYGGREEASEVRIQREYQQPCCAAQCVWGKNMVSIIESSGRRKNVRGRNRKRKRVEVRARRMLTLWCMKMVSFHTQMLIMQSCFFFHTSCAQNNYY
jgi:hypothetical protein